MIISSFTDQYSFLSNFHRWKVIHRGMFYNTAEHAFQANKAESREEHDWVMLSASPGVAKRRSRKVTIRPDWEDVKVEVMFSIVQAKFNPIARADKLRATGNATLIEGNYWHDQFWGNCECATHADIEGRNMLGKILMFVRSELTPAAA